MCKVFIEPSYLLIMEQQLRTIITFVVLIFIVFGLYFFSDWFSKTTGFVLGEDEKLKLAQCLGDKSTFYKSSTCPECDKQLEHFGKDASRFLNIVSCLNVDECPAGGVPAWKIGSQIHYGVKNLDELTILSDCAIK